MGIKVAFEHVEIRDYPIILGNNPSTDYGPSIELDWKYNNVKTHNIDEYETKRQKQRRQLKHLYLSQVYREWLLKEGQVTVAARLPGQSSSSSSSVPSFYTEKEIKQATKLKEFDQWSRWINNRLRLPHVVVGNELRQWRRQKRIKRAIRNLNKKNIKSENTKGGGGDNSSWRQPRMSATTVEISNRNNVYDGWWLPFSAYIL